MNHLFDFFKLWSFVFELQWKNVKSALENNLPVDILMIMPSII